jgi:hypothetical protein
VAQCNLPLDFVFAICKQAGVPVIITDVIKDWPAASWTPDVLKEQFGEVVVPVEISQWHKKAGRWGDYRDLYADPRDQWDCGEEEVFTPTQESEQGISLPHNNIT